MPDFLVSASVIVSGLLLLDRVVGAIWRHGRGSLWTEDPAERPDDLLPFEVPKPALKVYRPDEDVRRAK